MKNTSRTFLFWITLATVAFAFAFTSYTPDYDLWARLIVGKSILENGIILKTDFLSYTPTHFWYDHEWGAGLVFYFFQKLFEIFHVPVLTGFVFLKGFFILLIMSCVCFAIKIRTSQNNDVYRILYFFFGIFAANVVFASTVRCHMFTFLFFALWILILELYRKNTDVKLLFILPFSMMFWANIHGGCLSGLGLLILYSFGEFSNRKNIKPYLFTLLLSLVALFVNPYGFGYVKFLFFAGTMDRSLITEWASPFALTFGFLKFKLFFFFMLIVSSLSFCKSKFEFQKTDKTKITLVFTTAVIAILHAKLLPFFVIASMIFLFDDVYFFLKKFHPLYTENKFVYIIVYLFAFSAFAMSSDISPAKYPFGAVNFIKQNNLKGNVFADLTYGSYIAYKLYPGCKIFADGRYEEVYGQKLINMMKDFASMTPETENITALTAFPAKMIIFQRHVGNKKVIPYAYVYLEKNFNKVYEDENFGLFLIKSYPVKDLIPVKSDLPDLKTLFDTNITKEILMIAGKSSESKNPFMQPD